MLKLLLKLAILAVAIWGLIFAAKNSLNAQSIQGIVSQKKNQIETDLKAKIKTEADKTIQNQADTLKSNFPLN